MNTIVDFAELREFSAKEVCDIISVVMLISEQGVPNEVSIKDVILNACSNEHFTTCSRCSKLHCRK